MNRMTVCRSFGLNSHIWDQRSTINEKFASNLGKVFDKKISQRFLEVLVLNEFLVKTETLIYKKGEMQKIERLIAKCEIDRLF